MKKLGILVVMFILSFSMSQAMEMGNPEEIPIPDKSFSATLYDIDDMPFDAMNLAFNKYTYISGKRGATDVYIPFDRIKTLKVTLREEEFVHAVIVLLDGAEFTVKCKNSLEFTGNASFGQFRLKMQHVKSLEMRSSISDISSP